MSRLSPEQVCPPEPIKGGRATPGAIKTCQSAEAGRSSSREKSIVFWGGEMEDFLTPNEVTLETKEKSIRDREWMQGRGENKKVEV